MPVLTSRLRIGQRHLPWRPIGWGRAAPEPSPEPPAIPELGPEHFVADERKDELIDLLNARPAVILDSRRVASALEFGFAGGMTAGALTGALTRAPIAASDWKAPGFADALFVPELIDAAMKVRVEGLEPAVDKRFLARLLTQPPRDPAVVDFRRAVLAELAGDAPLLAAFRRTYADLYRLREMFDSSRPPELSDRLHPLRVLTAVRDALARVGGAFASCSSGLARIHRFAERARASDGYKRLCEMLDYENHLASVDLKLRLGSDGRIRHLEVTRASENRRNRFYRGPLGRLWLRFFFFARGYALGEGELVRRWVDSIFDGVLDLLLPLVQLVGEMEFYLSALALKERAESHGLAVCFPELADGEGGAPPELAGLFNPLLFAQGVEPVPCEIGAAPWASTTLVTGPNSGGKTRLLQAIGIAQMLGQCGMYAPAARARLSRASGLYASLAAEAKADQREGRLGTELLRIRSLFENARPGSLIILDELCSGTNPSEGEEIVRLVLSLLGELKACVFISTHFLEFAARLAAEPAQGQVLRFLQVSIDDRSCPTFKFVPGVAKTSLAYQTAARLGVSREELLLLVRRNTAGNATTR
jgi:DNA mismatch repair protein MutS2